MKVVPRYTESTSGPIIKPQWPLVFEDCIWVLGPVVERLAVLQRSAAQYPHIKPGEDFTGYS